MEGERIDTDFITEGSELRNQIGGEEFGVATSHINIRTEDMHETIQNILEFGQELQFVKNNIVGIPVNDSFFNVFQHIVGIAQLLVAPVIQSYLDMIWFF